MLSFCIFFTVSDKSFSMVENRRFFTALTYSIIKKMLLKYNVLNMKNTLIVVDKGINGI